MRRRTFLAASAAALAARAAPAIAQGERQRVLRFVPQTDVAGLDPVWTPTYPTRDHAFAVFDTLYGQDAQFRAQPQMVEGHVVENDGLTWKLTLRAGLMFHDATPVLARDCVASIDRWAKRDSLGQALIARTAELSAPDDRTIQFRLRRPFPLLPDALGKMYPRLCVMMPERLARTDPMAQVTEMVGSGPFRFRADERVAGARMVYERFDRYQPRASGAPSGSAGPKIAHFDRVEWRIIPDPSTVLAALQNGEVDWWWTPDADLVPLLRRNAQINVQIVDPTGQIGTLRYNHLTAPFNNPAIRRALFHAVNQEDFMTAVVGADPTRWRGSVGFFPPGTPFASEAGMDALTAPRDLARARRALEQAGYRGEKVVVLAPTDIANLRAIGEVSADLLRRVGMNVDYQSMGWNALVQRRFRQEPVEQGGWSVFSTFWGGLDQISPAGHVFIRGNGQAAGPGWPTSAPMEALREAWLDAPDEAAQKRLADQMQRQAFDDAPYLPLGQMFNPTAHRRNLTGLSQVIPAFWNVRRE
jgi:peptide/nickel transport system substrate-binding protein